MRDSVTQLTDQLDQAQLESSSLANQLGQAESTINSLETQLENSSLLKQQRDRQLNSLTGQLAKLDSTSEQLGSDATKREEELSAELVKLNAKNNSLSEQLRQANSDLTDALTSLTDRDQQISRLQDDLEIQKRQLSEIVESHSKKLAELTESIKIKQGVEARLSQVTIELRLRQTRFERETAALQKSHEEEIQTQQKTSSSALTSSRIELKHYQQQTSELNRQLSELTKGRGQSEQRAMDSARKLELAEAKVLAVQNEKIREVEELNQQLKVLQQQVAAAKTERGQEVADLESKLATKENEYAIAIAELETALKSERADKAKSQPQRSKAERKMSSPAATKSVIKDLTLVSGIGPVAAKKLHKLGVKTIDQIAAWTDKDVQHFSETLAVGSRIINEKWVKQAKQLIK